MPPGLCREPENLKIVVDSLWLCSIFFLREDYVEHYDVGDPVDRSGSHAGNLPDAPAQAEVDEIIAQSSCRRLGATGGGSTGTVAGEGFLLDRMAGGPHQTQDGAGSC